MAATMTLCNGGERFLKVLVQPRGAQPISDVISKQIAGVHPNKKTRQPGRVVTEAKGESMKAIRPGRRKGVATKRGGQPRKLDLRG